MCGNFLDFYLQNDAIWCILNSFMHNAQLMIRTLLLQCFRPRVVEETEKTIRM